MHGPLHQTQAITMSFGTAINCMDGRVQTPVSSWMKRHFRALYVDTITEAGPDRILAKVKDSSLRGIRRKIDISRKLHGSRVLAVVSHHDCGGNPVSKDEHFQHLEEAVKKVVSWDLGMRIVGLWVPPDWVVERVHDTGPLRKKK